VLKAPTEGKVRILFPKSAKLPKGFLADFRNIPAGSFLMGSDLSSDSNSLPEERPQHRVYLDSFKIGCTPVTVGDWSSYMRDTFTRRPEDKGLQIYLPITNVSWYDAIEYCTWITSAARLAGHIRVDEEITLPSEAQWEKAARGTDGRIFPWGDIFEPTYVNYRDSGTAHPVDVGIHPVEGNSPYGVADMAGNVWEWTRSLWGRSGASPEYGYPYCPEDGREDLSAPGDVRRIIRGGSWYYFDYCLRCSTRNLMYPYVGHSGGGFRLVIQKTKPIL
jgi:formylglycine-generating enzyme required for sulfatase activity